jgi:hypothetical protein
MVVLPFTAVVCCACLWENIYDVMPRDNIVHNSSRQSRDSIRCDDVLYRCYDIACGHDSY